MRIKTITTVNKVKTKIDKCPYCHKRFTGEAFLVSDDVATLRKLAKSHLRFRIKLRKQETKKK